MTQPIPMFEVVPPPEKPNEFMVFMMDHVFNPVETADWRVEKIVMHPQEWSELQRNAGDNLDPNGVQELRDIGLYGHLYGADVYVDSSKPKAHMEVIYGDLKKKNVVCLMSKHLPGAKCANLDCLVDAVHDL